jgi:hypothetical protein
MEILYGVNSLMEKEFYVANLLMEIFYGKRGHTLIVAQ